MAQRLIYSISIECEDGDISELDSYIREFFLASEPGTVQHMFTALPDEEGHVGFLGYEGPFVTSIKLNHFSTKADV